MSTIFFPGSVHRESGSKRHVRYTLRPLCGRLPGSASSKPLACPGGRAGSQRIAPVWLRCGSGVAPVWLRCCYDGASMYLRRYFEGTSKDLRGFWRFFPNRACWAGFLPGGSLCPGRHPATRPISAGGFRETSLSCSTVFEEPVRSGWPSGLAFYASDE
jgi:hypothetical protein